MFTKSHNLKLHFIVNKKNFYGQPIDSDIKQYEKIWKLTAEQGEDRSTWWLLTYDHIKNHFKLITVYFKYKKTELDAV